MTEDEKADQLNTLVDRLFGPVQRTILGMYSPPFDTTRPNIHDSKKEFLRELNTVVAARDHLQGVFDLLIGPPSDEPAEPLQEDMIQRLKLAIERDVQVRKKTLKLERPRDLALRNLRDTGFFYNSIIVIIDLQVSLELRLRDLKEQEVQFWSVGNRPPNYYARVIALRFARLFAARSSKRPTFGISSEGSHPSTQYGRALEEVFRILEIRANVRKAAEWALTQLTEDDWRPKANALASSLTEIMALGQPEPYHSNALRDLASAMQEKGK